MSTATFQIVINDEPPSESTHTKTLDLVQCVCADGSDRIAQRYLGRKRSTPDVWALIPILYAPTELKRKDPAPDFEPLPEPALSAS